MAEMKWYDWIAIALLVVGGINWGLVGALGFNLVDFITFGIGALSRGIYIIVGLASLYSIYALIKIQF